MYDFPKRVTSCRLMRVIFSTTIRTGESPFTKTVCLLSKLTLLLIQRKMGLNF